MEGAAHGQALASLTGLIARPDQTPTELAGRLALPRREVESGLDACESKGWVTRTHDRYAVTVDGLETFYRTLAQIRDTLSPRQAATATLPFTLRTTWRECLCFNYLVDAESLATRLPAPCRPVLKDGWGIVSVAAASLLNMRPAGLPEITGKNFCHITFRAVAEYSNAARETRRGYVFLESLTNSETLSRIGNSVTEFKFHRFRTGDISFLRQGDRLVLGGEDSSRWLKIVSTVDVSRSQSTPPESSIFESREELDALVIDHADAFGFVPGEARAFVLTIDRDPWDYRFVAPEELHVSYFTQGQPFDSRCARLDSVLHCRNVGYRWRPLERESLAKS